MLPSDESFLVALQPADVDGQLNIREKEMLLAVLRFYFGPANKWGQVEDVTGNADEMAFIDSLLRQPGDRYEALEKQTSLGEGYFDGVHQATDQVKLYAAAKPDTSKRFLYEARHNLTFYAGPDTLHGDEEVFALNALVLDARYRPVESYTVIVGQPKFLRPPE